MNFYKEFFKICFEISFSFFIIIFGYNIWNTFDLNSYQTAKYYENNKELDLLIDENKLYIHNLSDKDNTAKLVLKTNKEDISDNIVINFNNEKYYIKDLECKKDEYYCYYIINNIELNGYETKEFNYNIINDNINYEIVATI